MKKTLLFVMCLIGAMDCLAQADGDYYLNIIQDSSEKYPFKWDADSNYYTVTVPELWGDFKIYAKEYVPGGSNQDQYIFGATNNSNGVTVGSYKMLCNPGSNLCIEGGGILYNAQLQFRPGRTPTLMVVGGSATKPEPVGPSLELTIDKVLPAPTGFNLVYSISTINMENPTTWNYDTRIYYKKKDSTDEYKYQTATISTNLTGQEYDVEELEQATTYTVYVLAYTTYDGKQIYDVKQTEVTTLVSPILIGTLEQGSWQPDKGVLPTDQSTAFIYHFNPVMVNPGEFSFVTKLNPSWDVVNSSVRYAPSEERVDAPLYTDLPYTEYHGSTTHAWQIENFNPDNIYDITFDYKTRMVRVFGIVETSVDKIEDAAQPAPVNVYSISGALIQHNVDRSDAAKNLPAGLYIIGNEKVIVK